MSVEQQIAQATTSALVEHDKLVDAEKKNYHGERDDDYYAEMAFNRDIIPQLVRLNIPMMELGSRYRVAMKSEFYNLDGEDDTPLVEHEFETTDAAEDGRERKITGVVDAVLYDKQTETYILYDWKVRGRLLDPVAVMQDIQLALYATVLNSDAYRNDKDSYISLTRMYQMLKTPPKPAKLKKDGTPSVAKQASYFEFWWNSLPTPFRSKESRSKWEETMSDKLRQQEDWVLAVDNPVTWHTMEEVSDVVEGTLNRIESSIHHMDFLATWGAHSCEFCQFKKLCQARRTTGNIEDTVNELYTVKAE
jgi:hypothetical protein